MSSRRGSKLGLSRHSFSLAGAISVLSKRLLSASVSRAATGIRPAGRHFFSPLKRGGMGAQDSVHNY